MCPKNNHGLWLRRSQGEGKPLAQICQKRVLMDISSTRNHEIILETPKSKQSVSLLERSEPFSEPRPWGNKAYPKGQEQKHTYRGPIPILKVLVFKGNPQMDFGSPFPLKPNQKLAFAFSPTGQNMNICPVVKSILFKTNNRKSSIFISANGSVP